MPPPTASISVNGLTGERSQRALLRVSGQVRCKDLRVESAAELAFQSGQQDGESHAFSVLRSHQLRLVLLDHDQSVVSLVRCVELNVWFAVNPDARGLRHRWVAQGLDQGFLVQDVGAPELVVAHVGRVASQMLDLDLR